MTDQRIQQLCQSLWSRCFDYLRDQRECDILGAGEIATAAAIAAANAMRELYVIPSLPRKEKLEIGKEAQWQAGACPVAWVKR